MSGLKREAPNMKEMGPKAYKNRIKRDSEFADKSKDLPYSFSKPKKTKPARVYVECGDCSKDLFVTDEAILVVCGSCKGITRIKDRIKKD